MSKVSGVSNALIYQIETGKVKDPGFSIVIRLVDALGVTLDRAATSERARRDVLRKARARLMPSITESEIIAAAKALMHDTCADFCWEHSLPQTRWHYLWRAYAALRAARDVKGKRTWLK